MDYLFYIACALVASFMAGVYVGWNIGWRERGEASDIVDGPK